MFLCEKDDLAQHTSSASSKLIHGGLRYLEYHEFSLVQDFTTVRVCVHQPRLNHFDEWTFTVEDLLAFEQKAMAAAYHALQVAEFENPQAYESHLRPSEDACRFCKAKGVCPKLRDKVLANAPAREGSFFGVPKVIE